MTSNSLLNTVLLRSAFFFLISYGMLYFSYKHYSPVIGGGIDFLSYYNMYLQPLNFGVTGSPFIYRQFAALITFFIVKSGIYYNTEISYVNVDINQQVFFAAILSNYIALFFTAHIVSRIVDLEIGKISISMPLLAGILCYMSFGASAYVLTGLVEGWTWFLIALGFYAFRKKNIYLLTTVLIISIFQKEVISITFGAMSFTFFLITFLKNQSIDKKYLLMFFLSLLSFLSYIVIRTVLLPIEGTDEHLAPSLMNLLEGDYLSLKFIVPTLMSQNLLYIYILFLFLAANNYKQKNINNLYYELKIDYAISLMVSFLVLYLVGMAVGIGSNIGRVVLGLSPVFSVYIALYMYILDRPYTENH